MIRPIRLFCVLAVAAVYWSCGTSFAYQLKDLGLEKKAQLSTTVIVGTVTAMSGATGDGGDSVRYATVRVETTLKGSPTEYLKVLVTPNVAELNISCCKIGGRYLLFLLGTSRKETYEVVDGQFGIYAINRP